MVPTAACLLLAQSNALRRAGAILGVCLAVVVVSW